ncbi:ABC-type transport system, involved in lipoprotein release, permease component [Desulfocicer vacuolatum DSM 3385]|uniref:ABC-type transport system, involved in lipoprotein release, permease component n=1 Tax=Desulfocicer vacuolatum DSM 3385 TaxID=1121400 RepID=A0A1W2A3M2_9BACT|nr:ABC transporter permease [Desulfocicer vacuolatum]SMC55173.1 ABC-type transport system, involved in lipoprotein release, permease component [Desulfocicer vacuolatum DSM 3385]
MIIMRIAFRNIFRQQRRSLFTALSMIIGFILLAVSFGFGEGGYGHIIEMFTHSSTGHIQIHSPGYLERPNLYKNFQYTRQLQTLLKNIPQIQAQAPRIHCGTLAFIDKKTTATRLTGVAPLKEKQLSTLADKVGQGQFLDITPAEAPHNQIIIGNGLARILKASIGSDIALVSQGADGSIANDLFKVVGILKKEVDGTNRNNAYIHIYKAQEFLAMGSNIHEVAVILTSHKKSRQITKTIKKQLKQANLTEYEVHPWEKIEELFYRSMSADKKGNWIFLFIIGLIVALGVLNTVLMSILERTREFGVMRAVGTRPSHIFLQIVLETLGLSFMATTVGALCAGPILWPFVIYGIPMEQPITIGGIEISTFKAGFVPGAFIIPFLVIVITATLVSVFPAIHASRVKPVDAMKTH